MKIIVYTPEICNRENQRSDRHKKIVQLLDGFEVIEHSDSLIKFSNEAEKINAKMFIDSESNILIAHYSDISRTKGGNFEELLELDNAIAIYHTDLWNYNNFLKDTDAVGLFDLSLKSIAVGSDKVLKNVRKFVDMWVDTGNLKLAYFELIGFDPEHENLLKPFETVSPIEGSEWNSTLIHAKRKLNEYLLNNK